MMDENSSMLEMYVLENMQLLEQLEELLLGGEKEEKLSEDQINETFRVMHTVKGSSAMMRFDNVTHIAHAVEDMFSKIREKEPPESEWEGIFDVVLESIDFIRDEIRKAEQGMTPDGDGEQLYSELQIINDRLQNGATSKVASDSAKSDFKNNKNDALVAELLGKLHKERFDRAYVAKILFEEECQMETVRAYGIVISLAELCTDVLSIPIDLEDSHDEEIRANGLSLLIATEDANAEIVQQKLQETMFVQSVVFEAVPESEEDEIVFEAVEITQPEEHKEATNNAPKNTVSKDDKPARQNFISVNVNKIDKLMNLVGEIVTTEAMVTKNPDIADLRLENFDKQARRLQKLTGELQDVVMSVRMIPIAATFHKMQRIVRDICKKKNKEADLVIIGEDTEVDKSVIDHLSDPLMHLIRNAMDHGMETADERVAAGKNRRGKITLEAKNAGGDIVVRVMDDGKGMDKERIVKKAIEKGLTDKKASEISDSEAFGFIMMPGFSTNEEVTEYSGRGVGMDVVRKNIEQVGGRIFVDSEMGKGSTITMHIPLTLAILDGMKVVVGSSVYIIPILAIREIIEPALHKLIIEPNGNELIMIRGECYPILRLHEFFNTDTQVKDIKEGIMVLIETGAGMVCLFADKLLGEQQAVIKPIPAYISKIMGRVKGISGCSIMGDGGIALVLDMNSILS